MGNDVVIYCAVDRHMVEDLNLGIDFSWVEEISGYSLIDMGDITEFGGYVGHRLWKTANWIGDIMWVLRGLSTGEYPYIKAIYIGGDCSSELVEATEEVVLSLVSKFIRGEYTENLL